jgi:hypothetical protein
MVYYMDKLIQSLEGRLPKMWTVTREVALKLLFRNILIKVCSHTALHQCAACPHIILNTKTTGLLEAWNLGHKFPCLECKIVNHYAEHKNIVASAPKY